MSKFITDNGGGITLVSTDETIHLERYGVWVPRPWDRKPEVVKVSNDLEALQAEFGPDLPVYELPSCRSES